MSVHISKHMLGLEKPAMISYKHGSCTQLIQCTSPRHACCLDQFVVDSSCKCYKNCSKFLNLFIHYEVAGHQYSLEHIFCDEIEKVLNKVGESKAKKKQGSNNKHYKMIDEK